MGAWQPASESLSRFCYHFVPIIIAGKGDHGGASASRRGKIWTTMCPQAYSRSGMKDIMQLQDCDAQIASQRRRNKLQRTLLA
jgi:hypothetical protein